MRAVFVLAVALFLYASPGGAGLTLDNRGSSVLIQGDHFRLVLDTHFGGMISTIQLYDGGQWNNLFSGPGSGFPALAFQDDGKEYRLGLDTEAKLSGIEQTAEGIQCSVETVPRAEDGTASPWQVRLDYMICHEGAVFVDLGLSLPRGATAPGDVALRFDAYDGIRQYPRFRDENVAKQGNGFPSARIAFGVNPEKSFTNEVEVFVEHKRAVSGDTEFQREGGGRFVWRLGRGASVLSGPFEYRNAVALGLGAGAAGRPRSTVIGQRVYHWVNWLDLDRWYPTREQIDKMAARHGTMLILHMEWMRQRGSNGKPHADYAVARNHEEMVQAIDYAHEKGLRVGLYMRGIEPYALDTGFFEKYCRRDWDGIYTDWHGPAAISWHETKYPPEDALGDTHFTTDGSHVPAKSYFLFTRRLRAVVGAIGFLIGHQGSFNSGVLANLCFDAYLPGETGSDRLMFSDIGEAGYKGMMGGGVCMPWTLDLPAYRNAEGVAKMAVWGAYPHLVMGLQSQREGEPAFSLEADAAEFAFVAPYWRLLARIDVEKATVFNLPNQNRVAMTSSNRNVQGLIYRAGGRFLIIVANLGSSPTSAALELDTDLLGMFGEYVVTRIDAAAETSQPAGTTQGSLSTSELPAWGIEGYTLTKP